eukprot:760327-Hanusia_phi.AAC.6
MLKAYETRVASRFLSRSWEYLFKKTLNELSRHHLLRIELLSRSRGQEEEKFRKKCEDASGMSHSMMRAAKLEESISQMSLSLPSFKVEMELEPPVKPATAMRRQTGAS